MTSRVLGRDTTHTVARGARAWDFPPPPTPVPGWFTEFSEAVAGLRLSERGNVELVARQEIQTISDTLTHENTTDFYERLARWFLANPAERPRSPF